MRKRCVAKKEKAYPQKKCCFMPQNSLGRFQTPIRQLHPTCKNGPMSWSLHFFHSKSINMDEKNIMFQYGLSSPNILSLFLKADIKIFILRFISATCASNCRNLSFAGSQGLFTDLSEFLDFWPSRSRSPANLQNIPR